MKFYYVTEGFTPWSGKSLTEWMNERGEDGWQIVHFEKIMPTPAYNAINYQVIWMRQSAPTSTTKDTK